MSSADLSVAVRPPLTSPTTVTIILNILCIFGLTACGPGVSENDLPELPDVDVDAYLSVVAEQLRTARAAVSRKPTKASTNGRLGMLYRCYRDYDAAEVAFRRARMLAPRNPDWIYYHGEVLERRGQIDESVAAMRALLTLEPSDPPARLRLARLLTQQGNYDEATETLQSLLRESPQNAGMHMAQATLLERRGDLRGALKSLDSALDLAGSFGRAHYASALIHRRLGQEAQARRNMVLFKKYRSVSFPGSDPRFAALLRLNLSDKPIVQAAQVAKAKGNHPRAIALLEKAIERNPHNMETRAALISAYAATGDYSKSEKHYDLGTGIDPGHIELQYASARLRISQGRLQEAITTLSEITRKAPQHVNARAWLGYVLQLRGKADDAGTQLRKAFEANPENPTARRFYSRWLLQFSDPTDAVGQLEKMAVVDGIDTPTILFSLYKARTKAGDLPGAVLALDRGIELAELWENPKALTSLRNERRRLSDEKASRDGT